MYFVLEDGSMVILFFSLRILGARRSQPLM